MPSSNNTKPLTAPEFSQKVNSILVKAGIELPKEHSPLVNDIYGRVNKLDNAALKKKSKQQEKENEKKKSEDRETPILESTMNTAVGTLDNLFTRSRGEDSNKVKAFSEVAYLMTDLVKDPEYKRLLHNKIKERLPDVYAALQENEAVYGAQQREEAIRAVQQKEAAATKIQSIARRNLATKQVDELRQQKLETQIVLRAAAEEEEVSPKVSPNVTKNPIVKNLIEKKLISEKYVLNMNDSQYSRFQERIQTPKILNLVEKGELDARALSLKNEIYEIIKKNPNLIPKNCNDKEFGEIKNGLGNNPVKKQVKSFIKSVKGVIDPSFASKEAQRKDAKKEARGASANTR